MTVKLEINKPTKWYQWMIIILSIIGMTYLVTK